MDVVKVLLAAAFACALAALAVFGLKADKSVRIPWRVALLFCLAFMLVSCVCLWMAATITANV